MGDSALANQTYSEEIVTSVSQTRGDFLKKAASVIMEYAIKLLIKDKKSLLLFPFKLVNVIHQEQRTTRVIKKLVTVIATKQSLVKHVISAVRATTNFPNV